MAKIKQKKTTDARSSKARGGKTMPRGKIRWPDKSKRAKSKTVAPKLQQVHPVLPAPERDSKKGSIATLLRRQEGASIAELTEATGWQQHSIRAAMTGLRKEGGEIQRSKDAEDISRFRLAVHA